jgi:flavin-binding protein dodecin
MSSGVYKAIEMVGTSEESFDDAVRRAVQRAGETMRELEWIEVMEQRGYVKGGMVREFQVKLKVWFKLDEAAQTQG